MAPPIAGVDGNWSCPSCQNVNYAARTACNRCSAPKPRNVMRPGVTPPRTGGGGPVAGVDGNWACPACQNVNFAMREVCNRCQMPKPVEDLSGRGRPGAPVAGMDGNWACSMCGNVNWSVRDACNRCQTPKEEAIAESTLQAHVEPAGIRPGKPVAGVDGAWACAMCGNINYAMRDACNRCQTPRHEAEAAEPPAQAEVSQMTGHSRSAPVAGVDGNWACALCNNVNYAMRDACNRCQAPKDMAEQGMQASPPMHWPSQVHVEPAQGTGKPVPGVDGNWICVLCQNINLGFRQACNRCQEPRPASRGVEPAARPSRAKGGAPVAGVDGNWACPSCQNVNFGMRVVCNRCSAPKPAESELDVMGDLCKALEEEEAVDDSYNAEPSVKRVKLQY